MFAHSPPSTCRARYCNSLSNRTCYPFCINGRSDRRLPSRLTSLAVRAQQEKPGLHSAELLKLSTILAAPNDRTSLAGELKANVVFPSLHVYEEGAARVRVWPRGGVVLFMHGFAQGPTAYARMLRQLAKECDVLVVAPCPPFGWTLEKQQSAMVEAALFWRGRIAANALPGIIISPDEGSSASSSTPSSSSPASCPLPVGLLAHSVGGGLAPYVVAKAAENQQPFQAVHVMAPQTGLVWCKYRYQSLGTDSEQPPPATIPTPWAVQYGCLDLLSPAFTVAGLLDWLTKRKELEEDDTFKYDLGTHVGFEDQLVVGVNSFTASFLSRLPATPLGTAALLLLALGSSVLAAPAVLAGAIAGRQGKKDSVPEDVVSSSTPRQLSVSVQHGFGKPDKVELPDERSMLLAYVVLAGTFTAAAVLLLPYDWQWDSPGPWLCSAFKAFVTVLAVFAWPNILVFPYEAYEQRPKVRSEVVAWCHKTIAVDVPRAMRAAEAAAPPAGDVTTTTAVAAAAAAALSYGIISVAQALQ